jgi:hypothetical protein
LSTYRPGQPPAAVDPATAAFLRSELSQLKQALERPWPWLLRQTLHAEPEKILAGMEVLADGTNWDPGSGAGFYRRNSANTAWEYMEASSVLALLNAHLADATDAHDASAISNVPAGTIAATDVQAAINELDGDITAHLADATDAHDASAISSVPAGGLAATDVQAALNELDTEKQPLDATLTALAAANWAANAVPIGTGADTLAQTAFAANTFPARSSAGNLEAKSITDFGLSLVDDADAAAARTTLGVGAVGTQGDGDKGDITVSGTGATWTIDNDVVTYAKMQNVSATDRLLGRQTAGAGDVEEITCTSAGRALLDDASASAQRTTLGVGTGDSPTFVAVTLSNGQIAFPATQVPSADANTLDDYEEGDWTPVLTFATPGNLAVTYSTQIGRYTKIGRLVVVSFSIITSAFTHTTASSSLTISGLPFAVANTSGIHGWGGGDWGGITKASYTDMNFAAVQNTSTLFLRASGSGVAPATVVAADMPTGGTVTLRGAVSYFV